MLQVYLEVPGFLGGGKRKARNIVEKISNISKKEGDKAQPYMKIFRGLSFEKVHFISIGGSVMHSLAIELKRRGFDVTGSDDAIYEPSKSSLLDNNLLPKIGLV